MDSDWMRDDEGLARSQFEEPQMESGQKGQALCSKNSCDSVIGLSFISGPFRVKIWIVSDNP